jgi:DNA-binding FrmR family transcriptional regulator
MEPERNNEQIRELLDRLARIEGQIRGVSKMIQNQQPCDQVLVQVMAARAALEKVASAIVTYGIDECFTLPPEEARQAIHRSINLLIKV